VDGAARSLEDDRVLSEPVDFRRLYLFRHPELDLAHQNRAIGAGPAALSRRGRAQVLDWVAMLEDVELAAVHASPQPQCLEPALALAAARQQQPIGDERLRDQEMGSWQGQVWEDLLQQDGERVRAFFRDFGEVAATGGESLGQAVERVLAWWVATAPGAVGKSLAVVMPGSVLSGFGAALLGLRLSRCVSLNLPHGGLGVLDAYDNGVRIQCWNPGALA
jgi:broad specificity phosphatase PhoE